MGKRARERDRREVAPVRFAVVGLGWIAQDSILPAFAQAAPHAEVTALVSDDPAKLKKLGRKYQVSRLYSYDDYELCLQSGEVEAVFIALPNHLHCQYAVAAAHAGVHVLCEKPMAMNVRECVDMIAAAEAADVRLMIAYRLHFEPANLSIVELVQSGKIGTPRFLSATYSMQVEGSNVRLDRESGGGALPDIGIYCINCARAIFQAEPEEVFATAASQIDPRFRETPEMVAATLRFPGERLVQFTCSFGAAATSAFTIVGAKGSIRLDPAYSHRMKPRRIITVGSRTREKEFRMLDQFAAELVHFSQCVRSGESPTASGWEGMADVHIISGLNESMRTNSPMRLTKINPPERPSMENVIRRPPGEKPKLVRAREPSRG